MDAFSLYMMIRSSGMSMNSKILKYKIFQLFFFYEKVMLINGKFLVGVPGTLTVEAIVVEKETQAF